MILYYYLLQDAMMLQVVKKIRTGNFLKIYTRQESKIMVSGVNQKNFRVKLIHQKMRMLPLFPRMAKHCTLVREGIRTWEDLMYSNQLWTAVAIGLSQ